MMIRIRFVRGPALWVGIGFYVTLVAVPAALHAVYGSWLISIGVGVVWAYSYFIAGCLILPRLTIPIHLWKLLASRSPHTRKANEKNADSLGMGTLNGCDLYLALIVDKAALTVGVCQTLFLWPKSVTIPWDQVQIDRVGTNYDGKYVAVVSVPSIHGCEMVLPWRRKFAKILDQVELARSPTAS